MNNGELTPFEAYTIVARVHENPSSILLTSPHFSEATSIFWEWSETIWVELENALAPKPTTTSAAGRIAAAFGPEQVQTVVEPLVNKEKWY